MVRKMFLTVYHTAVLAAAVFGNLEPAQKKQLLRHLHLEKAYHAPAFTEARNTFDRGLKQFSRRVGAEIKHAWRN